MSCQKILDLTVRVPRHSVRHVSFSGVAANLKPRPAPLWISPKVSLAGARRIRMRISRGAREPVSFLRACRRSMPNPSACSAYFSGCCASSWTTTQVPEYKAQVCCRRWQRARADDEMRRQPKRRSQGLTRTQPLAQTDRGWEAASGGFFLLQCVCPTSGGS